MADYCLYCMSKLEDNGFCPVGGATHSRFPSEPHHINPGTVLADRYLTGRVLGEGGFSITYIALDLKTEVKYALKEYYPRNVAARITGSNVISFSGSRENAVTFEKGKQAFLISSKNLENISLPGNITAVRGHFEANNTAYALSEFAPGESLAQAVEARGKLKPEDVLRMTGPLFDSIDVMHSAGVIHHDISPENIIIENGKARLADIGIARDQKYNGSDPASEAKHYCASPEHYSPTPQTVKSDIYSLAATIYFALTGYKPERAPKRLEAECLTPPTRFGARISPQQEEVILQAMSLAPENRYGSAAEFRSDFLAAAAKPAPVPVRPPVQAAPVRPADNGNKKKKFIFIGAAAAVVVILITVLIATSGGGNKIETDPGKQSTNTSASAAISETTSPDSSSSSSQQTTVTSLEDTTRPPEPDNTTVNHSATDGSETEETEPEETSETEPAVPVTAATTKKPSNTGSSDFTIQNGVLVSYHGSGGDLLIPSTITSIGNNAFKNYKSLYSVTIPSSVKSIGSYAFSNCTNLKTIMMSDGITSIGEYAFSNCSSLKKITIPANVSNIEATIFSGCTGMTEINVQKGNKSYTSVDGVLFNANKTVIISYPRNKAGNFYDIPSTVTRIEANAFTSCKNLKGITLSSGLKTIGDYAFYNCTSLTTMRIEGKIVSIGKYSFYKCSNISNIVIGTNVTSIGTGAFKDCDKLTRLNYKGTPSAWKKVKVGDLGKTLNIIYNYAL